MGKGFSSICNDILGWDLRSVFQQCCSDVGLQVDLRAVINDAVATLLSSLLHNESSKIGLIVGTGINASVRVPVTVLPEEKLIRCNKYDLEQCSECILNTELSMFGSGIIPLTRWDVEIDDNNERPGFQPLEMVTSGRYISEIARYIVRDTILNFRSTRSIPSGLYKPGGLEPATMSAVEGALDIQFARQLFQAKHPCKEGRQSLTIEEMKFMKAAFYAVSSRAAAIIAAALLAICISILPPTLPNQSEEIIVAVTGSIIERYFGFQGRVQQFLNLLGKRRGKRITLIDSPDSSIWGAAVAAACN
ncbi:hypothetical protein V1511DRAFT_454946 [Dipodascopsis uninucleata]